MERKSKEIPWEKYQGFIGHKSDKAEEVDANIFRADFGEFEDVPKRTPLKDGRANTLIWSSIVEKFDIRSAYPFSACVGMNISTEEFPTLPTRSYLVRGRKVRVPENAVPRDDGSLEFNGSFDGSLGEAVWTTCPVCIFYDLLVNERYGAGHFIDKDNLSWVDLYPLGGMQTSL